ncbi:MAG TPA: hypothetical protein VFT70_00525 [Nocardioides sp.]|nr:hypothetical protein [Nocardioides sp.]
MTTAARRVDDPDVTGLMTTVLAVVLVVAGLVAMLRAVTIVATGGRGRVPFDPLVSIVVAFGLVLLGQALLQA